MQVAESVDSLLRLDGKVAVVTGATRGIGAVTAKTLASAGAAVVVAGRNQQLGDEVVAEIEQSGGKAMFYPIDVREEAQWESMISSLLDEFGGFDILVNNAGVLNIQPVTGFPLEEWRELFAINVEGYFLGIKHAVEEMRPGGKAGKGGAIVNVSSVSATCGVSGYSAYGASKGAVASLTRHVAIECATAQYNIRVNTVSPSVVKTEMAELDDLEMMQALEQAHPLGFGEPEDVANTILFLVGDASRYMTGAEVLVDGGLIAKA